MILVLNVILFNNFCIYKYCMAVSWNDGFHFSQFNLTNYSWCLVPVWRLLNVAQYFTIV